MFELCVLKFSGSTLITTLYRNLGGITNILPLHCECIQILRVSSILLCIGMLSIFIKFGVSLTVLSHSPFSRDLTVENVQISAGYYFVLIGLALSFELSPDSYWILIVTSGMSVRVLCVCACVVCVCVCVCRGLRVHVYVCVCEL